MQKKYIFDYLASCNMCGNGNYKILGKRLNQTQGKNPRNKIGITTTIVKCEKCGLIYPNPFPIPEKLSDHYGMPPELYWKDEYFTHDSTYFQSEINTLKTLYAFKANDRALDIGAGIGKCMISLANAGFDVYGLEPSEPFYRKAIDKMKIEPNKLQLSSIETSSYPHNHFDFITFGAVLEHLYNPSSSIQKALEWLKVGGIMQIEVPSSDWLINKLLNLFYKIKGLDYVANISPMHEPFHLYEFSLNSFIEHSKSSNYTIIHHEYYVAQTYMPRILNFVLVPWMKKTKTGMQLCVWLKKK